MFFIGLFAALLSAASWGIGTIIFDRIGKSIPATGLTFLKGIFSVVLMLVFVLISGFDRLTSRELLFLALSGFVGISLGDTFFFLSLKSLGAKTQVLFFMLGQVFTILLAFLFLDELLTPVQYVGIFIILGGIMVVIAGKKSSQKNKIMGILYGLMSILCFSSSSIMLKVVISGISSINATFYRMLFGTLSVFVFGLFGHQVKEWFVPLKDRKLLFYFLVNVCIITLGGFFLSTVAIKHISVPLASILSATEPIFVLLFLYFIFNERVTKNEFWGTLFTLMGIVILILYGE